MKRLSLAAIGLAIALSVGAQTTPEEKQEPAQKEGKAKVEQNTKEKQEPAQKQGKAKVEQNVKTDQGRAVDQSVQPKEREGARAHDQEKVRPKEREGARVHEQGGNVSHSTTIFRRGHETKEHLDLHRGFREQNDVHFGIGFHDRGWWLQSYSIVLMDGCYYYLADNGCWYPAYGFDPSCDYSTGVVYCE
jgi:hypothetical protein